MEEGGASASKVRNHLRGRLWAAWEARGEEIEEGDLEAVRRCLLERQDIKDALMAWDTSPERERRIKMAIGDFLCQRTTRLRALPSTVDLLYQAIASFGPLDPLLKDEMVTNILVNDWDQVYFDRMGEGQNLRLEKAFRDPAHYRAVFYRLVSVAGGVINAEEPCVDLLLPDGTRVNASMPPYTRGHVLSLRLFRRKRFSLAELQAMDTLDEAVSRYIRGILGARAGVIVGGPVGTGKTTLINAALCLLPLNERLVTAEDVPELKFEGRHWVAHYTRIAPLARRGRGYDLRFVVRDMLRKKADRIVVGEVRGPEALDMLLAMNAGTCGWSSCHGHSSRDVLARLCTFALLASENLNHKAIQHMVASVVDVVIMMGRCSDGRLRVLAVDDVQGLAEGEFDVVPIFRLREECNVSLADEGGGLAYRWEQLNPSRFLTDMEQPLGQGAVAGRQEEVSVIAGSNAASPLFRAVNLISERARRVAEADDGTEAARLAGIADGLGVLLSASGGSPLPGLRSVGTEVAP